MTPNLAVRASDSEAEAISAESEMNTTDPSTEVSITANVSASGAKLEKEQEKEMEFDNDSDLTGFRFIDCELLVQFVGSLLCPDCKRPLAAGRHSSTTEKRTGLASRAHIQM